ncbi:unnamed protein product [Rhodiola kirilowii]
MVWLHCPVRIQSTFTVYWRFQTLPNDIDLLNPPAELEKRKHKLKRLVQSPNSFFMDVKCQGCFNILFQTILICLSRRLNSR